MFTITVSYLRHSLEFLFSHCNLASQWSNQSEHNNFQRSSAFSHCNLASQWSNQSERNHFQRSSAFSHCNLASQWSNQSERNHFQRSSAITREVFQRNTASNIQVPIHCVVKTVQMSSAKKKIKKDTRY